MAVVDAEFAHHTGPLSPHGLVDHHRAIRVGDGAVEGAGGNAEDVSAGLEAHDVERVVPAQVEQVEGAAAVQGQQAVLLVGMLWGLGQLLRLLAPVPGPPAFAGARKSGVTKGGWRLPDRAISLRLFFPLRPLRETT